MAVEFAHFSTVDPDGWAAWSGRNTEVTDGAVAVATEPAISYTDLRFDAVDVSVDHDENVFVLRPSGDVYKHNRARALHRDLWTNGDGTTVADPRALCVFGDRIYVADGATGELVILSQRSESVVGRLDAGVEDPIDIVRSDRQLYILDRGAEGGRGRIVTLRRNGRLETVIRGLRSPEDVTTDGSRLYVLEGTDDGPVISVYSVRHVESPNVIPTKRTVAELRSETGETVRPVRIEALAGQELVVVGRSAATDEAAIYHLALDEAEDATEEWGRLSRRDDWSMTCSRLITGPARGARRDPRYYAIAGEENHVYMIDERYTHRRNPVDGRYSARVYRRFDSGVDGTGWHRVTLSFEDRSPNTQVRVSYHATDQETVEGDAAAGTDGGANADWDERIEAIDGPDDTDRARLHAAGVEGVWDLIERKPEAIASAVGDESTERAEAWRRAAFDVVDGGPWRSVATPNPADALVEGATGRYLRVRLDLVGDVDTSPRVGSFRVYCPRQTYLRHLPEGFQTEENRSPFLERYLSVFESSFVDIEEEIERLTAYFDPRGVPTEYLSWLGRWLAVEFDDEWPAEAKREFLVRAPALFRTRGTREGMERTIRLYLDYVENPDTSWMAEWQRRRIEARRADGRLTAAAAREAIRAVDGLTEGFSSGHLLFFLEHGDLDGVDPAAARGPYTMHMRGSRSFVVFIGPFVNRSHRAAVDRIVAAEKPAHTNGAVVEIRQQFKLEGSSFLGINTTLTPREFVLGQSTLGSDTVLTAREFAE